MFSAQVIYLYSVKIQYRFNCYFNDERIKTNEQILFHLQYLLNICNKTLCSRRNNEITHRKNI